MADKTIEYFAIIYSLLRHSKTHMIFSYIKRKICKIAYVKYMWKSN